MVCVLITDVPIIQALETEESQDFEALWDILKTDAVQGYITPNDVEQLTQYLHDSVGEELAQQLLAGFYSVLEVYDASASVNIAIIIDAESVDPESVNTDPLAPTSLEVGIDTCPIRSVSDFLLIYGLELLFSDQSGDAVSAESLFSSVSSLPSDPALSDVLTVIDGEDAFASQAEDGLVPIHDAPELIAPMDSSHLVETNAIATPNRPSGLSRVMRTIIHTGQSSANAKRDSRYGLDRLAGADPSTYRLTHLTGSPDGTQPHHTVTSDLFFMVGLMMQISARDIQPSDHRPQLFLSFLSGKMRPLASNPSPKVNETGVPLAAAQAGLKTGATLMVASLAQQAPLTQTVHFDSIVFLDHDQLRPFDTQGLSHDGSVGQTAHPASELSEREEKISSPRSTAYSAVPNQQTSTVVGGDRHPSPPSANRPSPDSEANRSGTSAQRGGADGVILAMDQMFLAISDSQQSAMLSGLGADSAPMFDEPQLPHPPAEQDMAEQDIAEQNRTQSKQDRPGAGMAERAIALRQAQHSLEAKSILHSILVRHFLAANAIALPNTAVSRPFPSGLTQYPGVQKGGRASKNIFLPEDWLGYGEDDGLNGNADNNDGLNSLGHGILNGGWGQDWIEVWNGRNTINGRAGQDEIWVWGGNNTITGGANTDYIFTFGGNNTIDGGAGNDYIDIDAGVNWVTGGGGQDVFVFWNPFMFSFPEDTEDVNPDLIDTDYAVITDFEQGQDTIELIGMTLDEVSLEQVGVNTHVFFEDDLLAVVQDVEVEHLSMHEDGFGKLSGWSLSLPLLVEHLSVHEDGFGGVVMRWEEESIFSRPGFDLTLDDSLVQGSNTVAAPIQPFATWETGDIWHDVLTCSGCKDATA